MIVNTTAEHIPGCSMAFRKSALLGGAAADGRLPMLVVSSAVALVGGYLARLRSLHTPWLVPEVIVALLILFAVLFKVDRYGRPVLHALQQAAGEHGIL